MKNLLILPMIALVAFSSCKNNQKSTDKSAARVEKSKAEKKEIATADYEAAESVDQAAPVEPKQQVDLSKYQPEYAENLFLRFKRTPCLGKCPVYEVNVYLDGHAVMEAKQNFDYAGYYQTGFTEDHIDRILKLANDHGFFKMDHVYDAPVTDLPSTTTIIKSENGTHWTYHRMNAPDDLRELETELETFIKDLQWYPYKPEKKED